jgi:RHS repeat-associated protein
MLRAYALDCDQSMALDDFERVISGLKERDWIGIRRSAEENAQAIAKAGGLEVGPDNFSFNEAFHPAGKAEVFFREGDLYYFQIISSKLRRDDVYDTEDYTHLMSTTYRVAEDAKYEAKYEASFPNEMRRNHRMYVEIGIVSSGEDDLARRLGALADDILTVLAIVLADRKEKDVSYQWLPRPSPENRIEALRGQFQKEGVKLNGVGYAFTTDGIGSVTNVIGSAGTVTAAYTYDPYGHLSSFTGTGLTDNLIGYAGALFDSDSNYLHMGDRWYNPVTDAFTSQDQNSFLANPTDGNRYAYAGDDPANSIDPTGNSILDDFFDAQDIVHAIEAPTPQDGENVILGAIAGIAADSACNFVLGVLDVPTGGLASVLGETGCTLAGAEADSAVG